MYVCMCVCCVCVCVCVCVFPQEYRKWLVFNKENFESMSRYNNNKGSKG